ncbi:hypothetical protein N008_00425 [Hymenobacter sp. APR13]|nr:hypothetical protein N008_00425 [Hymenobacter sp. APR13]
MEELFTVLFEVLMEGIFSTIVLAPVGFVYLYLRHRSRMQARRVLIKEYESSYANAGLVVVWKVVAAVGILLVLALLLTVVL